MGDQTAGPPKSFIFFLPDTIEDTVKSANQKSDIVLAYTSHSAPSNVVFVHGAGGNHLLWRRTIKNLSGGSNAFAVNLPGHPSGAITCTTIGQYAESLHDFILELGVNRSAVCGHSMGGAISLALALKHPEDVGALILVGTGARLGVDYKILEGLKENPMLAIEQTITPRSFNFIGLGLGREARVALSISNLPVFLNDYAACNAFDVMNEIPGIAVETLVVCGDKDRMTPPKWSHFLGSHIPEAELYFVKDSGHMIPLEKPATLSAIIQRFLEGLRS